ncbi:CPBP family intramembrane glutamic endopeptidase [Actinopolymorpha singaporensis]
MPELEHSSLATASDRPSMARPRRAVGAGLCTLALGACAIVPLRPEDPTRSGVLVAAAAVVIGAAVLLRSAEAIRTSLFIGPLLGCFAIGALGDLPPAVTTVLVSVLPLTCLLLIGRSAALRPAAHWLRPGVVTREAPWLGLATVLLSGAALTVWALVVRPEPAEYLRELQRLPLWLAILGIAGFAVVNPVWEELLFRGVLLSELAAVWGARAGVVLQAALFGVAHFAGFPSGVVGMIMAGSWGFALGVMRLRSGGVLIPYLVHVAANLVIGTVAVLVLR